MVTMNIYALDIETDTSISPTSGLDPQVGGITSVALVGETWSHVLETASLGEAQVLAELESLLTSVPSGTIASWNGSVFDFPFIDARARLLGVDLSLSLSYDPSLEVKYEPTPGYRGGYQVTWGQHRHEDVQYIFKDAARAAGVKWSLKPVGRLFGLDPIEVDRTRMHLLSAQEERDYVLSDAVTTRELLMIAYNKNLV